MNIKHGVIVDSVKAYSPAAVAGLQTGDTIISINGKKVCDLIDYLFYADDEKLDMIVLRRGKRLSLLIERQDNIDSGIKLRHFKVRTCKNRCIFCFVSQLPKGLRRSLYIKDEDYRMSFLYGNYITLTNISASEKRRIVEQRLSPLYISVHSTKKDLRNKLLGNPKATDVLKEIKFFKDHKIKMHCQIVLCPDYNDGEELQRTINDLYKFYPYVSSIAVVPVGLTAYRKNVSILRPLEKDDALKAIGIIEQCQRRFKKKHGDNIVYGADELYIKAGKDFPPLREYGDLPQIENGVGMVAHFLSLARSIIMSKKSLILNDPERYQFITFTGTSFYPYLRKFTDKLREKANLNITVIPVENHFFGKSVTVTGLLTGRDIIKTIFTVLDEKEKRKGKMILLIPDIVLKSEETVFLDDISIKDVEEALGIHTVVIEATPEGLIKGLEARYEN